MLLLCKREHCPSLRVTVHPFVSFELFNIIRHVCSGFDYDAAALCTGKNRIFLCHRDMYNSYAAASVASAVHSYYGNEDAIILCASLYIL